MKRVVPTLTAVAAAAGVAASAAALVLVPVSSGARVPTPDQQLVTQLEVARAAARDAIRKLTRPSADRATEATKELQVAAAAVAAAAKVAPRAVGALEMSSIRAAFQHAGKLARQGAADAARERYAASQVKVERALKLINAALREFGIPLAKGFTAFAVNRDFRNVPGFANYSGLSATVGEDISEIVIGPADRGTANAGERGAAVTSPAGLPITLMSLAVISDPTGNFTSGPCELESGLITCGMRPAMPRDRIFTVAFGPKLAKGTKLLVKFRSPAGDRSYAVLTTR